MTRIFFIVLAVFSLSLSAQESEQAMPGGINSFRAEVAKQIE